MNINTGSNHEESEPKQTQKIQDISTGENMKVIRKSIIILILVDNRRGNRLNPIDEQPGTKTFYIPLSSVLIPKQNKVNENTEI